MTHEIHCPALTLDASDDDICSSLERHTPLPRDCGVHQLVTNVVTQTFHVPPSGQRDHKERQELQLYAAQSDGKNCKDLDLASDHLDLLRDS